MSEPGNSQRRDGGGIGLPASDPGASPDGAIPQETPKTPEVPGIPGVVGIPDLLRLPELTCPPGAHSALDLTCPPGPTATAKTAGNSGAARVSAAAERSGPAGPLPRLSQGSMPEIIQELLPLDPFVAEPRPAGSRPLLERRAPLTALSIEGQPPGVQSVVGPAPASPYQERVLLSHRTVPEMAAVRGASGQINVHPATAATPLGGLASLPAAPPDRISNPGFPSGSLARGGILPPEPRVVDSPLPTSVARELPGEPSSRDPWNAEGSANSSRLSSPLLVPSLYPDSSRDTDEPHSTELGLAPALSSSRDRALLLRMDGSEAGEVHPLEEDTVQIGRHPTTRISVSDHGVSRVHARVYKLNGVHFVEDLGSRNGTFVQGRQVEHAVLEDGDTLQLGPRVLFRYSLVDARQEALLRQLYESSKRDALTGIYNRQHFEERLNSEVSYAQRHLGPVAIAMFDLDRFKLVNDTYGHPAGDAVLRHVAAIVNQRLRTEDVFARVGGEEFIVLLRGADIRSAARVAERIRVAVATTPVHFEGKQIPVSISIGCASLTCTDQPTAEALVKLADVRLYAAKNGGRNRVVSSG